MEKIELNLMLAGFLLCSGGLPARAQERSGEEGQLEAGARELNKKYSEGQGRVADKIKAQFGVDDSRLLSLHYRKLRYGEISILLALAQDMRGGITDENLHKLVALRQGPPVMGWGKVAKELGLELGPALSRIRKLSAEVRRDEKADKAKEAKEAKTRENENTGKAERPEKIEKAGMKSLARP